MSPPESTPGEPARATAAMAGATGFEPGGTPAESAPRLLPPGWALFWLVLVLSVLALGYWIGLRAQPPTHAEPAAVEAWPGDGR